ncbi:hypothetical protein HJC23_004082 [Cyclotella cryptica]|uniref:SET domain-containing protein n=1 Tax=Cyclotella cryptica TaxID=29204 RepID=A0ABD3P2Q6_9STRA|eukprot:CCRYP_018217-RA/>CCRYP_018217-RA protein AED:0.00 eAED:0.00 QI:693/-1/1/1/-1/1/1/164/713
MSHPAPKPRPTTRKPSDNHSSRIDQHGEDETDKFQKFERWLIANGAQFPCLELRKYDNSDRYKDLDANADAMSSSSNHEEVVEEENESEEKKDGGIIATTEGGNPPSSRQHSNNIDDGSDEMRGVHALTTLPPSAVIVSIPLRCLITVEMGQTTPIGRKILASDLELDAPKHIFLMIYLLWDKWTNGDKSFFAPYYAVLPKRLRNMPIFWDEEELRYLEGSHLLSQISDRIAAITRDYHSVCSAAPEFASISTLEEFTWARTIVCSRNFGLMINGRRTSALVPHADMLNHHRPRETKWTFCEETQCFTITTLKEIGAGEQVYDSYGQKCNHRFLLNYGFCVEKNVEIDGFCPNEISLELGRWGDAFKPEDIYCDGSPQGERGRLYKLYRGDDRECMEKKLAFWTRGDSDVVGVDFFGSSWHALATSVGRAGGSVSSIMESTLGTNPHGMDATGSRLAEALIVPPPSSSPQPIVLPTKRIRVCVSNNENTRVLFSMLRVLACNSAELDRISWGGRTATAAGQRLYGVPGMASPSAPFRTCRDIRYPISLRNERCAMEILREITENALSKYPTSLSQDAADLQDENAYPKYSNKRHAKLQVHGEKEVLHHFALWARTAIHVIDIILHELAHEIKLVTHSVSAANHANGLGDGMSETESLNEELGYDYVIQAMEDDDDCHTTILRYCADVLGAVRRDELNQIATEVMGIERRDHGL